MSDPAPRLLFVPVSGEFGMGEYARSLAIAQGVRARWPGAFIHFVISRRAPYAAAAPFPATLLDSSPTFHTAAVVEVMRTWRPDVVIFDNAGRTAQLRAAKQSGAHVVYISARRRQRAKAFRLSWMRLIDEHWIAYPPFIAGGLEFIERLKLRLMGRPQVRYLDVILARADAGAAGGGSKLAVAAEGGSGIAVGAGGEIAVGAGAGAGSQSEVAAGGGSEVAAGDRGRTERSAGRGDGGVASGDEVLDAELPRRSIVSRLGCVPGEYVLLVPGGGTGHPGASDAVGQFLQAGRELAAAGIPTVFVGKTPPAGAAATGGIDALGVSAMTANVSASRGGAYAAAVAAAVGGGDAPRTIAGPAGVAATGENAKPAGVVPTSGIAAAAALDADARTVDSAALRLPGLLPQSDLAELMRGARLIIANGGSTLLQAIACGKPCVGVAIAGDQAERIRRCVGAGVAVAAPLDASAIRQSALDLLCDEPALRALSGRAAALGLADGVEVAVDALTRWLESPVTASL